ncbi:MAG: serine hydrolase domain-containing protein [Candidatus Hydrogenedentales bacterium]
MNVSLRWTVLILLTAVAPLSIAADLSAAAIAAIDEAVAAAREEAHIPGLSVAVVRDGELIWAKGYGLADVENEVAASEDTVYAWASVSKLVTAAGALKLVEQGAIDLHKPVQTWCPLFPEKPWPITPHHLLSHQSGIRHWRGFEETGNTRHFTGISQTFRSFKDDALLFEPGTNHEYSTPAFNVLGCVIEGASDQEFLEYMAAAVFEPAGMTKTGVDDARAVIPNRADGYEYARDGLQRGALHDTSIKVPGGGLAGPATDLARFAAALFQGALLNDETRELVWTQTALADGTPTIRGYGCNVDDEKGRRVVWQIGGVPGFSGILYLVPEQQAAVALLTNMQASPVFPLASTIADAVLAAPSP